MLNNSILEILIPTYKREMIVEQSILSCLNAHPDISVFCNSNGPSTYLEKRSREIGARLRFTFFEENRGAVENFIYLLSNSTAEFCMLLSDEDSLYKSGMPEFILFLKNLDSSVAAVLCPSHYEDNDFAEYESFLGENLLMTNSELFASGLPVSTYMSGFVFSTNYLQKLTLSRYAKKSIGNVYPHLDILKDISFLGSIAGYQKRVIIKGMEAGLGGDAYSHKQISTTEPALNPLIYGPKARVRQFNYDNSRLINGRMNFLASLMFSARNVLFFGGALAASRKVTADNSKSIFLATITGFKEAIKEKEFCFNIPSLIIFILGVAPAWLRYLALGVASRLFAVYQRTYIGYLCRKNVKKVKI